MSQPADSFFDRAFMAMAHPERRHLLAWLASQPGALSASQASEATGIQISSIQEHLTTLITAGLVVAKNDEGRALYRVDAQAWRRMADWFDCDVLSPRPDDALPRDRLERQAAVLVKVWPEIDPDTYLIGQRLLRLSGHIQRAVRDAAAVEGLMGAEMMALHVLMTSDGSHSMATPTELQDALQMTPGGITKCIQRLEQAGLVRREPDPLDGRSVRVMLLPDGWAAQRRIQEAGAFGVDWVASHQLPVSHRHALANLLRRMLELADAEAKRRRTAGIQREPRSQTRDVGGGADLDGSRMVRQDD